MTELVRRGPGRKGRVTPRRGLPTRSAGDPGLASRTGRGPPKMPPPRKKTADSSRFSADSSLCGWKWVAELADLWEKLPSSVFRLPSSVFRLLPSAFCQLSLWQEMQTAVFLRRNALRLGRRRPATSTLPPADLHQCLDHVLRTLPVENSSSQSSPAPEPARVELQNRRPEACN